MNDSEAPKSERITQLIEVWKVLNSLTVSIDRIGHFWRIRGEDAGKDALATYLGPAMWQRISEARRTLTDVLAHDDPAIYDYLEALADREAMATGMVHRNRFGAIRAARARTPMQRAGRIPLRQ